MSIDFSKILINNLFIKKIFSDSNTNSTDNSEVLKAELNIKRIEKKLKTADLEAKRKAEDSLQAKAKLEKIQIKNSQRADKVKVKVAQLKADANILDNDNPEYLLKILKEEEAKLIEEDSLGIKQPIKRSSKSYLSEEDEKRENTLDQLLNLKNGGDAPKFLEILKKEVVESDFINDYELLLAKRLVFIPSVPNDDLIKDIYKIISESENFDKLRSALILRLKQFLERNKSDRRKLNLILFGENGLFRGKLNEKYPNVTSFLGFIYRYLILNDDESTEKKRYDDYQQEIKKAEAEKLAEAKAKVDTIESARIEAEEAARLEAARLEAEKASRLEAEEAARLEAEEAARLEAARLEAEKAARLEAEKAAAREAKEARIKAEEEARTKAEEEAVAKKAEEESAAKKVEEQTKLLVEAGEAENELTNNDNIGFVQKLKKEIDKSKFIQDYEQLLIEQTGNSDEKLIRDLYTIFTESGDYTDLKEHTKDRYWQFLNSYELPSLNLNLILFGESGIFRGKLNEKYPLATSFLGFIYRYFIASDLLEKQRYNELLKADKLAEDASKQAKRESAKKSEELVDPLNQLNLFPNDNNHNNDNNLSRELLKQKKRKYTRLPKRNRK